MTSFAYAERATANQAIDLPDPLARVRRSCGRIGNQARYAAVGNVRRLVDEIDKLFTDAAEHREAAWSYDAVHHYAPSDRTDPLQIARTATYVLVLAAINYGSGYAPWLRRNPENSTYYTLSTNLARVFDSDRLYDPDVLRVLDLKSIARIFGQDLDDARIKPFLEKLRASFFQIGELLAQLPHPDGLSFLREANFDATEIVDLLIKLPTFDDCCPKEDVFFYKKAQLFVADIARLGVHYIWWRIEGLDRLTLFADNAVAQVLRILGVIELRDDLAVRIDEGEALQVCSLEEIELRASTINAGQMLVEKIKESNPRHALDVVELDYYLWKISHENPYYAHKEVKRHLSLGDFY